MLACRCILEFAMEACFDISLEEKLAEIHTLWLGQGLKQKEAVNSGPNGIETRRERSAFQGLVAWRV